MTEFVIPGGILGFTESVDGDEVHLVSVLGVAEADLLVQPELLLARPGLANEPLRLQMRVKLLDNSQRRGHQVLGDVAHRDVIGEADFVPDRFKFAATRDRNHLLGQAAAQAEAGAAGREPKGQLFLKKR